MKMNKLALAVLLASAAIMLGCSSVTDGAGGNGGGAGTGGMGGTATSLCVETTASCESGKIDPIDEDPACMIGKPPVQPNACDGSENLQNPINCTPTETTVSYQLTLLEVVEDCNVGYDLDGCDGNSCSLGDNAPGEGTDGVDNALAGLAPLIETLGGNLGGVSQAFYEAICEGRLDVRFVVDNNPEQRCASVTTYVDGEVSGTVVVNRSEAGCLSGSLGTIPLTIGGITRALGNVVLRMTMTDDGFSDGIVGATLDQATVAAIAGEFIGIPGSGLVARFLDIDEGLERDPEKPCNALSVTLRLGGVASP
jgi:hypothetical protein